MGILWQSLPERLESEGVNPRKRGGDRGEAQKSMYQFFPHLWVITELCMCKEESKVSREKQQVDIWKKRGFGCWQWQGV